MTKTAILIDGGFYRIQAKNKWGKMSPKDAASRLNDYCWKHIQDTDNEVKRELYRIFYYDCPPSGLTVYNPLTKKDENLSETGVYRWTCAFYDELKKFRKVALRMGKLSPSTTMYMFETHVLREMAEGRKAVENLTEDDVFLNLDQKGVDMKIGLDMASMAYKKQVNQIILVAGDSDFVPAAKLARREGIDVILDMMGKTPTKDLQEHIDGLKSHWKDIDK